MNPEQRMPLAAGRRQMEGTGQGQETEVRCTAQGERREVKEDDRGLGRQKGGWCREVHSRGYQPSPEGPIKGSHR